MKKILIAGFLMAVSYQVSKAQSNKVLSAYNNMESYKSSGDASYLTKAKECIDLATAHEKTKDEPKTYLRRSQVYNAIYQNNYDNEFKKLILSKPDNAGELAYVAAPTAELMEAFNAAVKCKELDVKKNYETELVNELDNCVRHLQNVAWAMTTIKKYEEAINLYEKADQILLLQNANDSTIISNIANLADRTQNYPKAIEYYKKMIDKKVSASTPYGLLANIYLVSKDTTKAFETLKAGLTAYPSSVGLLITETNLILSSGKTEEAIKNLKLAIEKTNGTSDKELATSLHLTLGGTYDRLANPQDQKGRDLPKPKNSEELNKLAETEYLEALKISPTNADALFNLGVMHYNKGAAFMNADAKKAEDAKKNEEKGTAEFKIALSYLEKSLESSPKDKNTLNALKSLYIRFENTAKADEMKKRLTE